MASQYWESLANSPSSLSVGTALASSTTLTDISPAPQWSLGAGQLAVGQSWFLEADGVFSTTGTPTLLLGFYYGGVAGTALLVSAATTTGTGAAAWPFHIEMKMSVFSVGATGTVQTRGKLYFGTSLTAWTISPLPLTHIATVTVNTTTTNALTLGAQWGTSSASNTVTCEDFDVHQLN